MRAKSGLANYVTEQLSFLGRISSRSIFGGIGIFIDERLLGIVIDEQLYLHTNESNVDEFVSRGMEQFKPYPKAFDLTTDHHRVPSEIVEEPELLKQWGERALRAAVEASRKKQLAGIERSRHIKQAKKNQRKDPNS